MTHWRVLIIVIPLSMMLLGCGVGEPWEKDDPGDPNAKIPKAPVSASGQLEFEVKKNIYCELRVAFKHLNKYKQEVTRSSGTTRTKWLPDEWGAQLVLTMENDDNTTLNPNVSQIVPFGTMMNRTIGFGANLSSTATRLDKFNSYYNVGKLRGDDAQYRICPPENRDPFANKQGEPSRSSFLTGDLGIERWLTDALFVDESIPSNGAPATATGATAQVFTSPQTSSKKQGSKLSGSGKSASAVPAPAGSGPGQDAVSLEVKFVVVTTGTANPSWNLRTVSANTGMTPLISAGRTRTHDLILTVGPVSTATDYANLSLQFGQAVSASINSAAIPNR